MTSPAPLRGRSTLPNIPPFVYSPGIDPSSAVPLASLDPALEKDLASIVRSADTPRSSSVPAGTVVRGQLPFDYDGSFDAGDDEPPDPELESFFAPPHAPLDTGKGKGKAPPAPTSVAPHSAVVAPDSAPTSVAPGDAPTAPGSASTPVAVDSAPTTVAAGSAPTSLASASAPNAVASGSAGAIHPYFRLAGFKPGDVKAPSKYGPKDHKLLREQVEGHLNAGAGLYDNVARMRKDLSETIHALPLVYAQIAELYEAGSGAPNLLVTELWESHRVHGESIRQHGLGITDISGRLLPALLARIDSLQALVTQLNAKVDTLTLTATVPGSSSKRAREDDAEFEARNVRARADADGSAPFVYAPPVLLAPLVIPERTPAAPLRAPPAAPPAVQSAPPAAPPAVLRAPPAAPQATLRAPPLAPRAPPRPAAPPRPSAPAGTGAVPPRAAAVQTARPPTDVEVLFGPVRWNKDHAQRPLVKQDIAGLIEAVIPEGSIYEFTTRRCKSHDHRFTLVAFASADIADWVATAWTFANHGDYIETYAVYPPNV